MNCKPGDLAVIVRDPGFNGRDVGAFVEVVEPGNDIGEWMVRSKSRRLACFIDFFQKRFGFDIPWRSRTVSIPDAWLRPIRPPGLSTTTRTTTDQPAERPKEVA